MRQCAGRSTRWRSLRIAPCARCRAAKASGRPGFASGGARNGTAGPPSAASRTAAAIRTAVRASTASRLVDSKAGRKTAASPRWATRRSGRLTISIVGGRSRSSAS